MLSKKNNIAVTSKEIMLCNHILNSPRFSVYISSVFSAVRVNSILKVLTEHWGICFVFRHISINQIQSHTHLKQTCFYRCLICY